MRLPARPSWPRTLLALFLIALIVRVVFVFSLQKGFYFADGPAYDAAAKYLVEHGVFPTDYGRAPLYPLFMAAVYALGGTDLLFLRVVQGLIGAAIVVLVALIGRRAGGYWAGVAAGLIWTIYPMGVFIAGLIYPTTLITLCLAGGVLCLLPDRDAAASAPHPARCAVVAGVLFGLAALAKPIALSSVVFVLAWILLVWRPAGSLRLAGIFMLACVLTLVPWTVRNYDVHQRLVPIESRQHTKELPWTRSADAPAVADQGDQAGAVWPRIRQIAERYPREFISFFELYPRRVNMLKQEIRDRKSNRRKNFVRYTVLGSSLVNLVSMLSVGFIYVTALIGIWSMWRRQNGRPVLILLVAMVLSFAMAYAVSWGKIRYRIPVDPYIVVLSGLGIVYASRRYLPRGLDA